MRALWRIVGPLVAGEVRAVLRGFALTVLVLVMGVALLGVSGWFITAAAVAGLAGTGALFNVFVPSAMVRLLALGRTAARYGERVLTHDATLRALSRLRVRLMQGLVAAPWRRLERLRARAVLNRLVADIDALDGVMLRLLLPGLAGGAVILASGLVLVWLVHPWVGLWVACGYLVGPTLVFLFGARLARRPARRAEAAMQAMRSRLVDMVGAREDLAVFGQLDRAAEAVRGAVTRHAAARAEVDRVERRMGFGLDLIGTPVVGGVLGLGATLARAGEIGAPEVAIGTLAALALGETVAPVRRALAEVGRMISAARRVAPALDVPEETGGVAPSGVLVLEDVTFAQGQGRALFAPVSLRVAAGETVALTGPSGSGKSTLLLMAAGVLAPVGGRVTLGETDVSAVPERALRRTVAMVPQRHALIAGTVAENLRLAAPEATEADLTAALEAVALSHVVAGKGGLDAPLGFHGVGLSGGEARRLVLARALLRKPGVLLLDEPTEGLDRATAERVMAGLRAALPDAAILLAAHRQAEIAGADRVVTLRPPAS